MYARDCGVMIYVRDILILSSLDANYLLTCLMNDLPDRIFVVLLCFIVSNQDSLKWALGGKPGGDTHTQTHI